MPRPETCKNSLFSQQFTFRCAIEIVSWDAWERFPFSVRRFLASSENRFPMPIRLPFSPFLRHLSSKRTFISRSWTWLFEKQKPKKEKNGLKVGLVVMVSYSFVGLMMDYRLVSCGIVSDASIVSCLRDLAQSCTLNQIFRWNFVWKGMFPARILYFFLTFFESVAAADIFAFVVHLNRNFSLGTRFSTVTVVIQDDSERSKKAFWCVGCTTASTNFTRKN